MFGFVGENTLLDGKAAGVGVEVKFGDIDDLEVRIDDETLKLLGGEVEADV